MWPTAARRTGALVADLGPNVTFKIMYNSPKEAWYGPEDEWLSHDGTGYTWEEDDDVLTYQLYDLRGDPMETMNLWSVPAFRDARDKMVSLFCAAYLNMTSSAYVTEDIGPFLAAYRANGNFTTWVVETSAAEVYMPEWWSTPSMSNCTFARFLPHVAARDDDFHSSPP